MAIFFNFKTTSNHLPPLQVENCDSNSRLVVDEDDNGKFRLERVKTLLTIISPYCVFYLSQGMNFIAGLLLLIMKSEEKAFWMMDTLINGILPGNIYFIRTKDSTKNSTKLYVFFYS